MAGVNGIEIKVGQVWRCRDGDLHTVIGNDEHKTWPWDLDDGESVSDNGFVYDSSDESPLDLLELVQDENGFTIWRGGECPVPADAMVSVRFGSGQESSRYPASEWDWHYTGQLGITAYKLIEQQPVSEPKDMAADMLSDLGWHFDGTTWVQDAEMDNVVTDDPGIFAPILLIAAAKHMADRAATYDKPDGERSMAQTVAIFKEFHGVEMTEAQGWHFMQILKDVRLFTRATYHADSAEDCIAYAALKAEAKAQEGGAK